MWRWLTSKMLRVTSKMLQVGLRCRPGRASHTTLYQDQVLWSQPLLSLWSKKEKGFSHNNNKSKFCFTKHTQLLAARRVERGDGSAEHGSPHSFQGRGAIRGAAKLSGAADPVPGPSEDSRAGRVLDNLRMYEPLWDRLTERNFGVSRAIVTQPRICDWPFWATRHGERSKVRIFLRILLGNQKKINYRKATRNLWTEMNCAKTGMRELRPAERFLRSRIHNAQLHLIQYGNIKHKKHAIKYHPFDKIIK